MLTFQIVAINGWNRLAVGLRTPVGDYVSPFHPATGALSDAARRSEDFDQMQQLTFSLAAVPPYRLDLTAWALRRRGDNAIDSWDGRSYRRVLPELGGAPIEVAAAQEAPALPPLAPRRHLTGVQLNRATEAAAKAALLRLLGLETNLYPFYSLAADDPFLGPLTKRFRGLKPPRLPTLFECLVNAIACQQLTLTVGIRLLNRLAETYGAPVAWRPAPRFPEPAQLAGLSAPSRSEHSASAVPRR